MLILGIDTGGTYTDGVILERGTRRILCSAKALTTQHNLAVGIENCLRALPYSDWARIRQVSLSTTLATNAIVEGKGCRVGVLLLGERPTGEIPAEAVATVDARVDIRGGVKERLETAALRAAMEQLRGKCEAVAISGYASVRNPQQELQAAECVRAELALPVVCGHQLTGALGFYERTVTAALNARLIPLIRNLIHTVQQVMGKYGVCAPLYVVRGDGSMMRAEYAADRPVETVLSGPAASVIGAKFLSGREDCAVVDIGGTTTDIACLHEGECAVSAEGAQLGEWRTKVRALQICTFGLGGDSEIHVDAAHSVQIGPRRVVPFCRPNESGEESGLTPTDLLHIIGEYREWDTARAESGLRKSVPTGSPRETAIWLRGCVTDWLARYCRSGVQNFGGGAPMFVGVGAPARRWLPGAAEKLGIPAEIPPHAEVANAIGAAVGGIREQSEAFVRPNHINPSYYIYTERERLREREPERARQIAEEQAERIAREKAECAGAAQIQCRSVCRELRGEQGELIEWRVCVTARGYPEAGEGQKGEENYESD